MNSSNQQPHPTPGKTTAPEALPPGILPVTAPEAAPVLAQVTHIYSDLDGTLFAPGGRLLAANDGTPSLACAQALVALRQAGVEVVIVTGRNRLQGNEIMRILNIEVFIGEMGCVLMHGFGAHGKVSYDLGDMAQAVEKAGLEPGSSPAQTPLALIERSQTVQRLLAAYAGRLEEHNPYMVEREVTLMLRGCVDVAEVNRFLAGEELPLQMTDNGVIHPLRHNLTACGDIHAYHLVPRGTGKAHAVLADMQRRGLKRAQTVAIGDAVGDIEMGRHTGSLVVVANAVKSGVVEAALEGRPPLSPTFATQGCTADGWAEFAEAVLRAKGA